MENITGHHACYTQRTSSTALMPQVHRVLHKCGRACTRHLPCPVPGRSGLHLSGASWLLRPPVDISRPLHAPCASLRSAVPPTSFHPCKAMRSPLRIGDKATRSNRLPAKLARHLPIPAPSGQPADKTARHQQSEIMTPLHPRPTRNEQDHKSNGRRAHAAPRGSCRQIYSE